MTQSFGDPAIKANTISELTSGSGVTFGNQQILAASTTSKSSVKIPSGTAPSSPVDGDIWYDGTHFQARIGSTTYQLDQQSSVKAGLSSASAKVGGTIFSYITDAGNSTTVETDLYSDSILASTLGTNKDKIEARYAGEMVNSATATRQLRVYFGGTVIFDTGALSLSASSDWDLEVLIIRVSSTVVRYTCKLNLTGASLSAYCNVGELTGLTLSNANILKITGQAAGVGAATSDVVAKLGTVEWKAAP